MKCAKCGGLMMLDSDQYGSYVHCLMCGTLIEVVAQRPVPAPDPVQVANLQADLREAEKEAITTKRREYAQLPHVMDKRREYEQRPDVRARIRKRQMEKTQLPDVKAKRRKYIQRPDVIARRIEYQREYEQRPDVKARALERRKK